MNRMATYFFTCLISILYSGLSFGSGNKILLIGDSITYGRGSTDSLGFRDSFYELLEQADYPFSFVGKFGEEPYQGHFVKGARIEEFYTGPGGEGNLDTMDVSLSMNEYSPHIVVIHLGTNNVEADARIAPYQNGGEFDSQTASGKLANLIAYLIDGWGEVCLQAVFLSKIIPKSNFPEADALVQTFNQEIEYLVSDAESGLIQEIPSGMLYLIDQHTGFDVTTLLGGDGIHPTDAGYQWMTNRLFEAFQALPMGLETGHNVFTGLYDSEMPHPISCRIVDGYGQGVPGIAARFQIAGGDGDILSGSEAVYEWETTTDEAGYASVRVRLGFDDSTVVSLELSGLFNASKNLVLWTRDFVIVDGSVYYYANSFPVPGVRFYYDEEDVFAGISDDEGYFLSDSLTYGGDVTLVPEKDRDTGAHDIVLSYDAALVARDVVGLDTLNEWQVLAADVDRNGILGMDDAVDIIRYAIGADTGSAALPGNWVFHPSAVSIESMTADVVGQSVEGVLLGDVHGGWNGGQTLTKQPSSHALSAVYKTGDADDCTMACQIVVSGAGILACDFEIDMPADCFSLSEVALTEDTRHFQLATNRLANGKVRIGMYATIPLSGEVTLLNLVFSVADNSDPAKIRFSRVYLNETPVELSVTTDVADGRISTPRTVALGAGYPNPFNAMVVVPYRIDAEQRIVISVYDVLGRRVTTLFEGLRSGGQYTAIWDGRDAFGGHVSSGQYLIELTAGNTRKIVKLNLIR